MNQLDRAYKRFYAGVWEYFKWSNEFRAPKKGEFYLSGIIPEVYKAPNDLTQKFFIFVKVRTPEKELYINGFRYWLSVN